MGEEYEVELNEVTIQRDPNGRIIRHPLDGPYLYPKEAPTTHGYLSFAGHELDKSPLLGGMRVFFLEFFGEADSVRDREAWADPLRVEVLQRLTAPERAWYLGVIPRHLDGGDLTNAVPFEQERSEWQALLGNQHAVSAVVQSEKRYGHGKGFLPRLFFEVPNQYLANGVTQYWPEGIPGYPIEGYNMSAGQIELLREWDRRPRDDRLFREVMDRVFIAFYTFPAENRHFAFVTNKLDLDQQSQLIDIQSLKQQAREIGESLS